MKKAALFGVGVTDISSSENQPFYDRWKGVVRRCYRPAKQDVDRYAGCKLSPEWLVFSNFKSWMEARPWDGNCLDKDILRPDEKMYSPDTCVFVPNWINTLMCDAAPKSSALPKGIYLNGGRYLARVHNGLGARIYVGLFDDPDVAHEAWGKAKAEIIRSAVQRYRLTDRFDERVCTALLDSAEKLTSH